MDTIASAKFLQKQLESGEYFRQKEMTFKVCKCGKKFLIEFGSAEKLCSICRNQQLLLPKPNNRN